MNSRHPFSGFSKLTSRRDRLVRLTSMGAITPAHAEMLRRDQISVEWGEKAIENCLGYFQIPLGIVCLPINGTDRYIPYATEETSVVAAANRAGSVFRKHNGYIETQSIGSHESVGQILIIVPPEKIQQFEAYLDSHKLDLIAMANLDIAQADVERGGGVKSIEVKNYLHRIDDENTGVVLHVAADTVDAMGANKVVSICEFLGARIASDTGYEMIMGILTNYTLKMVECKIRLKTYDQMMGRRIEIASRFAEQNLFRAVTHNKGMANSLIAIATATGNDTRAVMGLINTYALESKELAISKWRMSEGDLIGVFKAPIDIGIIGGAIMHPIATISLEIMKVKTARELREVMGAAALAQNYAAISALVDPNKRFTEGHMRLHATNFALLVGASEEEFPQVVKGLIQILGKKKSISEDDARKVLDKIRNGTL